MNILLKPAKLLLSSVFIILLLGACSKNNIYIDLGDRNDENSDDPGKGTALITFNASVEGRNLTRAMTPMNKGLQSWLCAYPSSPTNMLSGQPTADGEYITITPGVLLGVQGYKMYLSNNTYSFYGVSSNSIKPAPTFNNGVSDFLYNEVDYLWWSALHQDITSSQVNIPVVYQHAATQMVITVEGGQSLTVDKIVSITITPPQPGSTMNLSTGIITPEPDYGKSATMGINGLTAQYIMLPIRNSTPMPVIMELLVNGETTPRTYNTSISLPDGELAGGKSYLFNAIIDENIINFLNAYVKEWTEVDESGNPLHPIQK